MCSKSTRLQSLNSVTLSKKHTKQRREGWRLSAQKKRNAEASVFQDLSVALPFPPTVVKSFDKVALLRLTACYIKLQSVLKFLSVNSYSRNGFDRFGFQDSILAHFGTSGDAELSELIGGGFLVILTPNGGIIYASSVASKYLQHDQLAVLGTNLYDYIHKSDHGDLDRLLSVQFRNFCRVGKNASASVTVRLQSDSQERGQLLRITGKQFVSPSSSEAPDHFFMGVAEPVGHTPRERLEHPLDYEFPYPQFTVYKTWDWAGTPDGKFFWDESVDKDFVGWLPEDLEGANVWELFHPADMHGVQKQIQNVFEQGHGWSSLYRLLLKGGGWAWFICQASMVPVKKQDGLPQPSDTYCIGRDYMISEVEEAGQVLATIQLGRRVGEQPENADKNNEELLNESFLDDINAEDIEQLLNFIGEEDGAWFTEVEFV